MFTTSVAAAVLDALAPAATAQGPIVVLDAPKLARLLADLGATNIVTVAEAARALKRSKPAAIRARASALPLAKHCARAVVLGVVGDRDPGTLAEAQRVADVGGLIALVGRQEPTELSAAALGMGLLDIEQRRVGRTTVVSGLARQTMGAG